RPSAGSPSPTPPYPGHTLCTEHSTSIRRLNVLSLSTLRLAPKRVAFGRVVRTMETPLRVKTNFAHPCSVPLTTPSSNALQQFNTDFARSSHSPPRQQSRCPFYCGL